VAGHPPILHYRAGTARIGEITIPHIPLGMFADRPFTSTTVEAAAGDLFVIVTDGLTEVFNAADEEFGMDRLKAVIAANATAPLPRIADAVLSATSGFGPQADDQTLLLVRVRATERPHEPAFTDPA
jgi:phosphoserine phosphatase RsbU/P